MNEGKSIIFTVSNDLSFDQRMNRICTTLQEAGYACTLTGRELPSSLPLTRKPYKQKRLQCWFNSGKLFYLEYNIRLWSYLRLSNPDVVYSVDIDTALPGYFITKNTEKTWVFDAHEFYSELEEVVSRPAIHRVWKRIERFVMKHFEEGITISNGYAELFQKEYQRRFKVVRNVPLLRPIHEASASEKPFIIYQGALNIGRGLEASVLAMHHIEGLELRIYGEGPIRSKLESLIEQEHLSKKVKLCGALRPDELRKQTAKAFCGLTLFSEVGLHHAYSFANRFFDYFHACIPQLAMDYPEYRAFNATHGIALLVPDLKPENIASAIQVLQNDEGMRKRLIEKARKSREEINWQKESKKLIQLFRSI